MGTPYSKRLQDAVRAADHWKFAAVGAGIAALLLGFGMLRLAGRHQDVLIPWGLVSANTSVKVTGVASQDAAYLDILARADLDALLNWTPETIDEQLHRFLVRLTPSAYAANAITLTNDAKTYVKNNVSESFYLKGLTFLPPDQVQITGVLDRWEGDVHTLTTKVAYTLTYVVGAQGVYAVDAIEVNKK